ncbi:hypothetical protein [Synoicihabitans lomoniglobus]|uniref:Uncharacterized protein n=1 Tax=Synoicihabitans lomoniglobus TaxID=2909285 RepID=A0AAF0CMQ9_9BACT|nr:hypothetical protein [Opitutaceae bacterium LMO-M01]WED64503.1 hypothetical protein PXH66_19355 [Opitutaceae bacterium LMO-M01]
MLCSTLSGQPKPRVVTSRVAPETTHHLYVGVDLYLPHDNEMMRVKNVLGRASLVETEDGRLEEMDQTTGFRWKLVPKVCRLAATVEDLKWEAAFSPRNDPKRQQVGRQTNIMNYQQDRLNEIDVPTIVGSVRDMGGQITAERVNTVMEESNTLDAMNSQDFNNKELESRVRQNGHDAIQLTFKISSPETMAHAFLVARARLRGPEGQLSDINFHREIGAVGPTPRKILHLQTGMPAGYEILDVKIHLFNNGKEFASNLSEKRFDLSAAEARQYLLLDHTANHRNETLPAQPVWELAPAELRATSRPADVDFKVSVDVDAEGFLTAIHPTEAILPDHVGAMIAQLDFLPALQNGQPVASTAVVNLADYFR